MPESVFETNLKHIRDSKQVSFARTRTKHGLASGHAIKESLLAPSIASQSMERRQPHPTMKSPTVITVLSLDEVDDNVLELVTRIWVDGLQQTVQQYSWPLSTVIQWMFAQSAVTATSASGDFGPGGSNLRQTWSSLAHDRQFFVAFAQPEIQFPSITEGQDDRDGRACARHETLEQDAALMVVGCVGIQLGTTFSQEPQLQGPIANTTAPSTTHPAPTPLPPPTTTTASIWRLSVAEHARNRGVGVTLMERASEWAKSKGCQRICLVTANPVAAHFYTKKLGYQYDGWGRYSKALE
jgi:GNAT superfamily N-acetyltransferase